MLEGSTWTETGAQTIDPFTYWAKKMMCSAGRTTFLERDQGFMINGIDVGQHGDVGPNGARGNRRSFTKIGVKSIIGHSHSPGIEDGVYQTGTNSLLALEYARGPSSWLHTDCIIYGNGKRTLINIIDGKWRI